MSIAGNDLLSDVENGGGRWTKLGQFLRRYVVPQIQNVAQNAAVSATSQIPAPDPPESISVTPIGTEHIQVVVNHTAPVQKGVQYFTHIATNPQMTNALIVHHGTSRSPVPIFLPTKDAGANVQNYYVATIAQYPGSQPSKPTFFGGATPVAVTLTGTTEANISPGTGSGTAANGGQTLVGYGKALVRL